MSNDTRRNAHASGTGADAKRTTMGATVRLSTRTLVAATAGLAASFLALGAAGAGASPPPGPPAPHAGAPAAVSATGSVPAGVRLDPGDLSGDLFGEAVAVSGSTAAVGSPGTSVDGVSFAGQVYLYTHGHQGWSSFPTATLDPPAPATDAEYGLTVALSNTVLVVGEPLVGPAQQGDVFVYVKGTKGWPTTPTTTLPDPVGPGGLFGDVVVISGNTIVVGAPGGELDSPGTPSAVYLYTKGKHGYSTTPSVTFADPSGGGNDDFGKAVAITGSTLVVGESFGPPGRWPCLHLHQGHVVADDTHGDPPRVRHLPTL